METKQCPCGGTMHHSDDMEDPFAGTDDTRPFWQCEKCGRVLDDTPETKTRLEIYETALEQISFIGTDYRGDPADIVEFYQRQLGTAIRTAAAARHRAECLPADAAPDVAEALRAVIDSFDCGCPENMSIEIWNKARAALAKLKGA